MSETLVGVLVGGGVALVSAVISAVVGPAITARHDRRKARQTRIREALAEISASFDGWNQTTIPAANGRVAPPRTKEDAVELHQALDRLRIASSDLRLRDACERAGIAILQVAHAAALIETAMLKKESVPAKYAEDYRAELSGAQGLVTEATNIALTLIEPVTMWARIRWMVANRSLHSVPVVVETRVGDPSLLARARRLEARAESREQEEASGTSSASDA